MICIFYHLHVKPCHYKYTSDVCLSISLLWKWIRFIEYFLESLYSNKRFWTYSEQIFKQYSRIIPNSIENIHEFIYKNKALLTIFSFCIAFYAHSKKLLNMFHREQYGIFPFWKPTPFWWMFSVNKFHNEILA